MGLIVCRGEYLMIPEGANQDLQRRVAYVLSHEIAHQWFGNLVTNRDWSDVYIQEGLATFFGYDGFSKGNAQIQMCGRGVSRTASH